MGDDVAGRVQLLGEGLDADGTLVRRLLEMGFEVRDFDPGRPLGDQIGDADVVLLRDGPLGEAELSRAPELKLVQRTGSHVYGVDLDAASAHGVAVSYVPTQFNPGQAVAEHTFYLLLALAKRARACEQAVEKRVVGAPTTMLLAGKTLGVVGLGRIGREMIGLGRAIGMQVVGLRQTTFPGLEDALHVRWVGGADELPELLAASDVVSLHVPAAAGNAGMIGASALATMKPGSLLLNTSRASLVDYPSVLDAIGSGRLGGFGVDVWWTEPADPGDPLLQFGNVLLTPHVGGAAEGARRGVVEVVAENVRRAVSGEPVKYLAHG